MRSVFFQKMALCLALVCAGAGPAHAAGDLLGSPVARFVLQHTQEGIALSKLLRSRFSAPERTEELIGFLRSAREPFLVDARERLSAVVDATRLDMQYRFGARAEEKFGAAELLQARFRARKLLTLWDPETAFFREPDPDRRVETDRVADSPPGMQKDMALFALLAETSYLRNERGEEAGRQALRLGQSLLRQRKVSLIPAHLSSDPDAVAIDFLLRGSSPLNQAATALFDGLGWRLVYSPRMLRGEGSYALADPGARVVYLPHQAILDGRIDEMTLHEIFHGIEDAYLKSGETTLFNVRLSRLRSFHESADGKARKVAYVDSLSFDEVPVHALHAAVAAYAWNEAASANDLKAVPRHKKQVEMATFNCAGISRYSAVAIDRALEFLRGPGPGLMLEGVLDGGKLQQVKARFIIHEGLNPGEEPYVFTVGLGANPFAGIFLQYQQLKDRRGKSEEAKRLLDTVRRALISKFESLRSVNAELGRGALGLQTILERQGEAALGRESLRRLVARSIDVATLGYPGDKGACLFRQFIQMFRSGR
jgi:hypothetical protein